jgi:hypothetical protein
LDDGVGKDDGGGNNNGGAAAATTTATTTTATTLASKSATMMVTATKSENQKIRRSEDRKIDFPRAPKYYNNSIIICKL